MAYTTRAELLPRLNNDKQKLARLAGPTAVIQSDADADAVLATADAQNVLDTAIDDYAETEIDPRVEGHLDITDSRNIDKLERINAVGTLYYLYRNTGKADDDNPFTGSHEANVVWLKQIQKREILTGTDPETPAVRSISNRTSSDRAFSSTDLEGF